VTQGHDGLWRMMSLNSFKASVAALTEKLSQNRHVRPFAAFAQRLSKNRHLRYGAPFIATLLVGVTVVKNFAQIRYDAKKGKLITKEEVEANTKYTVREDRTPEVLHEEYMKKDYVEEYDCVRGPRPWEDNKECEWEQNRRSNKRIKPVVKTRESYNI